MAIKNRPTMLNGINPLAYVGVNPYTPPAMYQLPRAPTVRDNAGFQIGDFWMNDTNNDLWYLAKKSNPPQYQDALWVLLNNGADLETLTGDVGGPVGPDANRNINTLGTAGEILVTGNPGTNTLTWSLANPLPGTSSFGVSLSTSIFNTTGNNLLFTIPYDEIFYNVGGDYDAGTGRYTAPHTGLYQFSATITIGATDVASYDTTGLTILMDSAIGSFAVAGTGPCVGSWGFIRNNPYATEEGFSGLGIWRHNGSVSLFLNQGDTVEVVIQVSGGAGNTLTLFEQGVVIQTNWFTGYNVT